MSGDSARYSWVPSAADRERVAAVGERLTRVLFGGRPGLALFCGSLVLFILTWRVGIFFNDIGLYPTMLEYLSEGRLSFGTPDEFDFAFPGMHARDGRIYGRSYGLVAPAVPILWGIRALEPVVDLRWALVVCWSGLAFATAWLAGAQIGRPRQGLAVGGVLATVAFVANAWFFKPLVVDYPTFALQIVTIVAGAVTVVAVYRVLADRHGIRVGLLGGATALLGTPVAFWATTPKRHTLAAMFVMLALFAFARSRNETRTHRQRAIYRGGAYACSGLLAWVHAPDGFTLFAALAIVDLPTATRNDLRTLSVVGSAFALSLVPYLVTNALVSGNPLLPPHFLDGYYGSISGGTTGSGAVDGGAASAGGSTAGETGSGRSSGSGEFWPVAALGTLVTLWRSVLGGVDAVAPLIQRGVEMYASGFVALLTEPERVFRTFLRWGSEVTNEQALFFDGRTNISVVESAPVLAALVALPVRSRVGQLRAGDRRLRDAVDPTDLVAIVFALLLTSLYLNRLPVHIQITVRYLHPLYPVAVYGLFRLPQVRSILTEYTRSALLSYEATILLGGPVSFGALLVLDTGKGAVIQTIGLLSLAVAAVLAGATLASRRDDRAGFAAALAFGAAVGVATIYLLLTAFVLFYYGPSALPAVDALAGEFRWLAITSP